MRAARQNHPYITALLPAPPRGHGGGGPCPARASQGPPGARARPSRGSGHPGRRGGRGRSPACPAGTAGARTDSAVTPTAKGHHHSQRDLGFSFLLNGPWGGGQLAHGESRGAGLGTAPADPANLHPVKRSVLGPSPLVPELCQTTLHPRSPIPAPRDLVLKLDLVA